MDTKILVYSDLHLEFSDFAPSSAEFDVVVLAGDIGVGTQGVEWAIRSFEDKPVVYICGNHEFYGLDLHGVMRQSKELAAGSNVHFLENDSVCINDVRFVCATLWTDMNLFGDKNEAKTSAERCMNDYHLIRNRDRVLNADDTEAFHFHSRMYLENELIANNDWDGPTVVVTHHAPSGQSLTHRRVSSFLSPAYASDLDSVIEQSGAELWIHGHTHESVDYVIGNTRVFSNPRGYARQRNGIGNHDFNVDCIITVH